jgi:nucleoside-diphosphate-sugar epimerase
MNILITGANGFLGSNLVKYFLQAKHQVFALIRGGSNITRLEGIIDPQLHVVYVDSDISDLVDKYDIDVIIHTATSYGRKEESFADLVLANEVFPLSLIQALPKNKQLVFINTHSSLHVLTNPYSISKSNLINWGKYLAYESRLKFINLKLEFFYGIGDDPSKFIDTMIRSLKANLTELNLTEGIQKRDFIHISDVVAAYSTILDNLEFLDKNYWEFDVGTGKPCSIKDLVLLIKTLTGNSATKLNFGAIKFRENELMESIADITGLVNLGWTPKVTLLEGIRQYIEEYQR